MKLSMLLVGIIVYILLVWLLRSRRLWLPYYALAVFGLTFLIVVAAQTFKTDTLLSASEMRHTHFVSGFLKIPTKVIKTDSIMIADADGWSILSIGIECSAILELSIFFGLIIFYPAFNWLKKSVILIIGLIGTYVINIIRILVIVGMVHLLGKETIFIAHAVVGRLLFFAAVIVLYWFLLTRPTLDFVAREVRAR
jgi:exosortase family protein XrtG